MLLLGDEAAGEQITGPDECAAGICRSRLSGAERRLPQAGLGGELGGIELDQMGADIDRLAVGDQDRRHHALVPRPDLDPLVRLQRATASTATSTLPRTTAAVST